MQSFSTLHIERVSISDECRHLKAKVKMLYILKTLIYQYFYLQHQKTLEHIVCSSVFWSERRDSNPGPLGPEPSAIPNFATSRSTLFHYTTSFWKVKDIIKFWSKGCLTAYLERLRHRMGADREECGGHDK